MIKRYNNKLVSYYREHAVLLRLAGLAVPEVLKGSRPGELHLAYVDGVHGPEAIDSGAASNLLREMGTFLRRLHQIDPINFSDVLDGEGSVIVHGDFAHYNCLMSTDETCLAAVIDWECAHLGGRIEDLAWCEFQFRNSYPQHHWAVSNLFEGYGEEPPHSLREQAVEARIQDLRSDSETDSKSQAETERPVHLLRFEYLEEAAAFVAALSRVLNSPNSAESSGNEGPEVRIRRGSLELRLNDQAVSAATRAFGHIRVNGLVFDGFDKDADHLLISGDTPPGWGLDEARRALRVS